MKKLLVILVSLGLTAGASAQTHGAHGGGGYVYHYHPRIAVGVGLGYGFGFGPYSPWGFYGPWGYPYPPYYYGQGAMPSRLALQVDDIKNDYKAQIKATRHDKTVPRSERKQRIRNLKHDRDQAIIQARKDYYYNSRRNYNSRQNGNNGNNNNGNNAPNNNAPNNNGNQENKPNS